MTELYAYGRSSERRTEAARSLAEDSDDLLLFRPLDRAENLKRLRVVFGEANAILFWCGRVFGAPGSVDSDDRVEQRVFAFDVIVEGPDHDPR